MEIIGPLDHVYYWTADMDRAVKFYAEVLGLRPRRREGSNWAEFDTGPVRFALHGGAEGGRSEHAGGTAVFRVEDLDAARAALQNRGASPDHEGQVEGYARYLTYVDPDGNPFQIIEYVHEG